MDVKPYSPTSNFTNVQGLLTNHFRFQLEALPDLTFFAQSASVPTIVSASVPRPSPLTKIQETGDALSFGQFNVNYLVDASMKSYASIWWWMKGYGFPHSNAEVEQFREERARRIPIPRPMVRDLEKTSAVLQVLQPDTDSILCEFRYSDVFPVAMGSLSFVTTEGEPSPLACEVTFVCTEFDLYVP